MSNDSKNNKEKIEYPIRINRYLLLKGFCSRRKADELVAQGSVKINGKRAIVGQKVSEGDDVSLSKNTKNIANSYQYFLLNKPRGIVSHNPNNLEKSAEQLINTKNNTPVSPVGRLDKDSEGLMLLTNDGRIIDKILNPKFAHEKEYYVSVDKDIKESFINKMNKGVDIEGYKTKPTKTSIHGPKNFKIILTEGKKHQIRRMCASLGYQVVKLKRTRIMNLELGRLNPGESRELTDKEKNDLFKSIKLD